MKTEVALGIDIGGTNTAFGFIDQEGNYLAEGNIPTNNHEDLRDYLKELHMAIENTLDSIRDNAILVGIGIGAPSANHLQGTIDNAVNLRWQGVLPFCDMMQLFFIIKFPILASSANSNCVATLSNCAPN